MEEKSEQKSKNNLINKVKEWLKNIRTNELRRDYEFVEAFKIALIVSLILFISDSILYFTSFANKVTGILLNIILRVTIIFLLGIWIILLSKKHKRRKLYLGLKETKKDRLSKKKINKELNDIEEEIEGV